MSRPRRGVSRWIGVRDRAKPVCGKEKTLIVGSIVLAWPVRDPSVLGVL
ncbi:hypothetical protein J4G37_20040 [Microvirga sp. 3-52]|nr:hypothetical protein [Microvirga sp. 3-52]